ncbi:MAG: site-specific integrase [Saprospiraceae bacterium]
MNTSVVISLDTRRRKKDGACPLVLRLTHHRKTTSISLGYSIPASEWDEKRRRIKPTSAIIDSVTRLNNLLEKKKSDALGIITKMEEEGKLTSLSTSDLRALIDGQAEAHPTVFAFTEGLIEQLLKARKIGNARVYKNVLGALKTYRKWKDMRFEEITYRFLKDYEAYFLGQGFHLNGLSFNMRTLRSIYNKALKEGVVEKNHYPFQQYKIKKEATVKRAIDQDALKRIVQIQLEPDHQCFHARNFFLASFMMYGMSFVDMAFLKKKDIVGDRIRYRRQKTGRLYDLKMTDNLREIFAFYLKDKTEEDFIFPFIRRELLLEQHKDLHQARKMYNKALKKLANLCDIEEHVTSYVSRHSFATHAMMNAVPLNVISAMLGHNSLATTEVYLKSLPSDVMDEYQTKLTIV